jgi:hypothetical protein
MFEVHYLRVMMLLDISAIILMDSTGKVSPTVYVDL